MRKELFDQLVESVNQMKEIQAGRLKPSRVTQGYRSSGDVVPDVAKLRSDFDLSQGQFAALLGISVDTLQNWEQGRRNPEGPARVLLRVAATHPEALLAVSGAHYISRSSGAARVAEKRVGYGTGDAATSGKKRASRASAKAAKLRKKRLR